jgi:hypothetical protein
MQGVKAEPRYVSTFRGEPGLESTGVKIGRFRRPPAARVADELKQFEKIIQTAVAELDRNIPVGRKLNPDQLNAVLDLCAWAHAEWVRIHPFANGNGRAARLWANFIAVRYGLPPFIRLRPQTRRRLRRSGDESDAGRLGANRDSLCRLLDRFLEEFSD